LNYYHKIALFYVGKKIGELFGKRTIRWSRRRRSMAIYGFGLRETERRQGRLRWFNILFSLLW